MRLHLLVKSKSFFLIIMLLIIDNASGQCYTANAGSDVTLCSGGATIGTSAISGYTYSWSPTTGLSNPGIAQPTANPSSTTTYTVTMTPPDGNLLANPGFESGFTSWSTDYGSQSYFAWLITQYVTNFDNSCKLEAHSGSNLFLGWCPDLSTYPMPGGKRAMFQTINVSTNTNYVFSGFLGAHLDAIGIEVKLIGNSSGTSTSTFSNSSTCAQWSAFSMNWNSGSNTQVTIEIRSTSDQPRVFAIDDLKFNCAPTTDQVVFTRGGGTSVTPAGPITYYNHYEATTNVVLTASAAPSYQWYVNELEIQGATNQTYTVSLSGLGSYSLNYYCVTPCGTSNEVEFNYIGCTTNNGYPVSVPTGACMSALTGGNSIALPTVSLGVPTAYSWWFANNPTCLSIGTFGDLTASGCSGTEANGIISKSTKGTQQLYMFYYFTANGSCRMAEGGSNNGPTKDPVPPRWNENITYITPNPAKYAVTIRSKEALNRIEFYNSAGVLVKTYAGNRQSLITIGISDLKPGIYMVRLVGASGMETKKLIIQ